MSFETPSVLFGLMSGVLFLLTAALCYFTAMRRRSAGAATAAVLSIFSVTAANAFLYLSYDGEPDFVYEKPVLQKARRIHEHEGFQREAEPEGGRTGTRSSGSQSTAAEGSDASSEATQARGVSSFNQLARLAQPFRDCTSCPEMVVIRPGVFRIGAGPDDIEATATERPTRMIGFSKAFAIGRHEITNGEFDRYLLETGRAKPRCDAVGNGTADKPVILTAMSPKATRRFDGGTSRAGGSELPVTCVSANDADAYVAWLSKTTRHKFRLPSEAEWEYAARAGSLMPHANGAQLGTSVANIDFGERVPVAVASFEANRFGVHDMQGNAAEIAGGCWVPAPSLLPGDGRTADAADCATRALRDGHAGEAAPFVRLSARRPIAASERRQGVGFRVARDL